MKSNLTNLLLIRQSSTTRLFAGRRQSRRVSKRQRWERRLALELRGQTSLELLHVFLELQSTHNNGPSSHDSGMSPILGTVKVQVHALPDFRNSCSGKLRGVCEGWPSRACCDAYSCPCSCDADSCSGSAGNCEGKLLARRGTLRSLCKSFLD